MSAGPQTPYEIDDSGVQAGQEEEFESKIERIFSEFLRFLKRFLDLSLQSGEVENLKLHYHTSFLTTG